MSNDAATSDSPRKRTRLLTICRWGAGVAAILLSASVLIALSVAWLWPDHGDALTGWPGRFILLRFYARVFQLHFALAALASALIAILVRFWRCGIFLAIASTAALLPYVREYVPKTPPPVAGRTIRILSMNLFAINRDEKDIESAIDAADADVIVACEVTDWSRREIFAKLAARYPHVVTPDFDSGEIVLSRLPFKVDRTSHPSSPRDPLIFTIENRPLALYPVHLTSPGLVSHLMQNRQQTKQLIEILGQERRPTVVVGDCNFSQLTPNYGWMVAAGLRTTQDLVGFGVGNTWGPKWDPTLNRLPGVRIDQMFLSRELTATSHHVGPYTGSDHRPIVADVGFAAGH